MTIAGSDSGGGAGIQADLKTFSALGVYGTSVITALTAQNTSNVTAIQALPKAFIAQQFETVVDDIRIDAIKIGMLGTIEVIETVAACLKAHECPNVVLDPVMVAKSGDKLLHDEAVEALRDHLLAKARIITPNIPEAMVLTGRASPSDKIELIDCAQALLSFGSEWALLKGGHLRGSQCHDVLVGPTGAEIFTSPRIATKNTHGTGCTLSSALAAELAKGVPMREAVVNARHYLYGAIEAADDLSVGQGHGPVNHFYALWS